MKPESCESLQKEAMDQQNNSAAWRDWEAHAAQCDTCAQTQKLWASLQTLASHPVERLGDARMRSIKQALAERHRPRQTFWWLWSSFAAGALLLILAAWFLQPKDPFSLNSGPTKWQQIASNPDWDLQTNDRLRHRIQAMRQDFRLTRTQQTKTIPATAKELKSRLERLRNGLETEE